MVLAGMAAVYGHALNTYATHALDMVNLVNGRVTLQALADGHPEPTLDAMSHQDFRMFDSGAFLRGLAERHGNARASSLAEVLMPGASLPQQGSPQQGSPQGLSVLESVLEKSPAIASLLEYEIDQEDSYGDMVAVLASRQRHLSVALANNISLPEFYEAGVIALASRFADRPLQELGDGGAVWHELRKYLLDEVLIHELGHAFGLRHNFRGSHDAVNYADAYWDLRAETLRPASEIASIQDVLTHNDRSPNQLALGMDLHAGSSVMDYSGFTAKVGLGRYDRAALLSSYAGAAEVFDVEPSSIPSPIRQELASLAISEQVTAPTFTETHHYSQVPYLLGPTVLAGLQTLRSRKLVLWQQLRGQLRDTPLEAPVPVPYEQCSDEHRVEQARGCGMFDEGADDLERSIYLTRQLEFEIAYRKFRRGRNLEPSSVEEYSRLMSRYLLPLRSIYQRGYNDFQSGRVSLDSLEGGTWAAGSAVGFNQLIRMLTTPEYGQYDAPESTGDWCRHASFELEPGVGVPMGIGRRFEPRYDAAGSFAEPGTFELGDRYVRRAALLAMTMDADPYGLASQSDLGFGYNEVFGYYLEAQLSDLFLQDYQRVGPRLQGAGTVAFPSFVDLSDASQIGIPPAGCLLELPVDDRERQLTVLLASLGLSESQTLVFHHRARCSASGLPRSRRHQPGCHKSRSPIPARALPMAPS